MKFSNRYEAGVQLTQELLQNPIKYDLVIALPRGGVPVGKAISTKLAIPLFLIYIKKIGHPENKEIAIGAISTNDIQLDDLWQIEAGSLQENINLSRKRIEAMKKMFNHEINLLKIKGKNILLVDDGIATGQSILLAIHELRKGEPDLITIATPICPQKAKKKLNSYSDNLICLFSPLHFEGISYHYEDFHQLSDQEVMKMLH